MKIVKRWVVLLLFVLVANVSFAKNRVVIIGIEGMTCPLCVSIINQVLLDTQGIISAKASLKDRRAVVIVPEGFDTNILLEAIAPTGYSGVIVSDDEVVEENH